MSKKIVLISCASQKLNERARAEYFYISQLFRLSLCYAKSLKPDNIYILSAEYELVRLDQEIDPYNRTLNDMGIDKRKEWADNVLTKISRVASLGSDEFILLAGMRYREFLAPCIQNKIIPLEGLTIGRQLQKLHALITGKKCESDNERAVINKYQGNRMKLEYSSESECDEIHKLARKLKRHHFPFDECQIPENGIYILFERGEEGHGGDRIVRIGTHTGEKQLRSRMRQHFINENKDRSIFRKNIGRAFLSSQSDEDFRIFWNLDLTTKASREREDIKSLIAKYNKAAQCIEMRVSEYLRDNFSFCVFDVGDKKRRLEIESKLISTISRCQECKPSNKWLGNRSPKTKIQQSGLWLEQGLYGTPFKASEVEELKTIIEIYRQ